MTNKKLYITFFTIYLILLILIVLFKFDGSFFNLISTHSNILESKKYGINNINLSFFKTISLYLKNIKEGYALKNIMGNIIAFVPMGFFINKIYYKKIFNNIFNVIFFSFLIIFLIEIIQLIFNIGYFDVDDIILNLLGCFIGYLLSLFLNIKYKKYYK